MKASALKLLAIPAMIAFGLSGCGVKSALTRTEHTRFLNSTGVDVSQRVKRLPFEHSWRDPSLDFSQYKHIVIRPVTTEFLRGDRWVESESPAISSKRSYLRHCRALARYWDKSLQREFSSPICMFYKTTDTSRPGTLILEIALTEVRFDRSVQATGASVASSGLSTSLPICAFEASTRDAATGKLVATSADRRAPAVRIGAPKSDRFVSPNESICDEWASQLMQRSNIELFPTVWRSWFRIF